MSQAGSLRAARDLAAGGLTGGRGGGPALGDVPPRGGVGPRGGGVGPRGGGVGPRGGGPPGGRGGFGGCGVRMAVPCGSGDGTRYNTVARRQVASCKSGYVPCNLASWRLPTQIQACSSTSTPTSTMQQPPGPIGASATPAGLG